MSALDFYIACILGGSLSTGLTHAGVTPLDVIKCNMQANPSRHVNVGHTLRRVVSRYGAGALFKGWVPTLLGYSVQGAVKFGLYEFFKVACAGMAGTHEGHKALVSMVGSAWSEFISDIFLCPFEAVKVRIQTHPDFGIAFPQAALEIVRSQGFKGLYNGLLPLWGRQIPYTVVKFACFEKTLEGIYKYILCTPKKECPKGVQLGVSFLAGYVSGVACALVSHPADNLVSLMNTCDGGGLPCALQKMGLVSLCTKGLWLRILMVGTMSGAQWGIYDAFKGMSGHREVETLTGDALIVCPEDVLVIPSAEYFHERGHLHQFRIPRSIIAIVGPTKLPELEMFGRYLAEKEDPSKYEVLAAD